MLATVNDVSAGGWLTLALPVGLLILVLLWLYRFRSWVK
jgi:hypothetical protein